MNCVILKNSTAGAAVKEQITRTLILAIYQRCVVNNKFEERNLIVIK
jgi:hypothetical protein